MCYQKDDKIYNSESQLCALMTMDAGEEICCGLEELGVPSRVFNSLRMHPRRPIPAWPFVSPEGKILPFLSHQETGSACSLSPSLRVKEKTREKGDPRGRGDEGRVADSPEPSPSEQANSSPLSTPYKRQLSPKPIQSTNFKKPGSYYKPTPSTNYFKITA